MAGANGIDASSTVAVIGAGIMGAAMARNLVTAGLVTRVWDRSAEATGPLGEAGAVVAASAREAAAGAGVVITMLPTAEVVESVIFDDGVTPAFADGCAWAQMGTIGVEATLRIRDRLAAQRPDVLLVDAPVSGSKGPAEQGQLLILASGPAAAADLVDPVFAILGRKTVWLGEAGQGSLMKIIVNAYMSILIEGVAETMELADQLGIGHQQLADCIAGGPLDAPIADAKLHKMDRGDYGAEFPLEWALKDVDLAIGAVGGQPPPLLAALSAQWHAAVAAGHGRQDISAARLALGSGGGQLAVPLDLVAKFSPPGSAGGPTGVSPRDPARCCRPAATSAANRRSSSRSSSGCHCTATANDERATSTASTVPSAARPAIVRPGASRARAWW
jgi:3-hydroxyisobutyrate dehydrogenase